MGGSWEFGTISEEDLGLPVPRCSECDSPEQGHEWVVPLSSGERKAARELALWPPLHLTRSGSGRD